jgi:hypothetical protein
MLSKSELKAHSIIRGKGRIDASETLARIIAQRIDIEVGATDFLSGIFRSEKTPRVKLNINAMKMAKAMFPTIHRVHYELMLSAIAGAAIQSNHFDRYVDPSKRIGKAKNTLRNVIGTDDDLVALDSIDAEKLKLIQLRLVRYSNPWDDMDGADDIIIQGIEDYNNGLITTAAQPDGDTPLITYRRPSASIWAENNSNGAPTPLDRINWVVGP